MRCFSVFVMNTSVIALIIKTPIKTITKNSSKSMSFVISNAIRIQMAIASVIFSEVIIL